MFSCKKKREKGRGRECFVYGGLKTGLAEDVAHLQLADVGATLKERIGGLGMAHQRMGPIQLSCAPHSLDHQLLIITRPHKETTEIFSVKVQFQ